MIITLPRGLNIDIDNVPENLEELVAMTFADYTEGTNSDHTYQDKLLFVDNVAKRLHRVDGKDAVNDIIKSQFEHTLDEWGEIMDREDFFTQEFMQACYEQGINDMRLYSHDFTEDRHDNEKIMKILVRVIKAVIDWEGKEK